MTDDRIDIEELAHQLYEKANEMGLEVLHVKTVARQPICHFTGSVAHASYELQDKIKLKFCHSGNYTLKIIRSMHADDALLDKMLFMHKGSIVADNLEKALLRMKDKMFVNV